MNIWEDLGTSFTHAHTRPPICHVVFPVPVGIRPFPSTWLGILVFHPLLNSLTDLLELGELDPSYEEKKPKILNFQLYISAPYQQ